VYNEVVSTAQSSTATDISPSQSGREPAWEIAYLFPEQGNWSEQEYLALSGNRLVEFSGGRIEVLTTPTWTHQRIVRLLFQILYSFANDHGLGEVIFAPMSVRLWDGKFRQPDIAFLLGEHRNRIQESYWDGADLVVEVVSNDDRRRDLETKRFEYARAGIGEYWIVDPQEQSITVLKLAGDQYEVHGIFRPGQQASSPLFPEPAIEVRPVFVTE
jgi:Uma2 family endonuclease